MTVDDETTIRIFLDINAPQTAYKWRVSGSRGRTLDYSGVSYATHAECLAEVWKVQALEYPAARIVDLTQHIGDLAERFPPVLIDD